MGAQGQDMTQRENTVRSGVNCFSDVGCLIVCVAFAIVAGACAVPSKERAVSGSVSPVLSFLVDVYQGPLNRLSAVRYGQCPMYPSCSAYCRGAIEKHGFVLGWMMSVDRLIRCGRDELDGAPRIFVSGRFKTYDPVENNDFWWTQD